MAFGPLQSQLHKAFLYYPDDICIDIKQYLVNSSFIFSFKLRHGLDLPQLRLLGGDEHMVCTGPICFNDLPP